MSAFWLIQQKKLAWANENNGGGTSSTEVSVFVERSETLTPELISTRVSVPED